MTDHASDMTMMPDDGTMSGMELDNDRDDAPLVPVSVVQPKLLKNDVIITLVDTMRRELTHQDGIINGKQGLADVNRDIASARHELHGVAVHQMFAHMVMDQHPEAQAEMHELTHRRRALEAELDDLEMTRAKLQYKIVESIDGVKRAQQDQFDVIAQVISIGRNGSSIGQEATDANGADETSLSLVSCDDEASDTDDTCYPEDSDDDSIDDDLDEDWETVNLEDLYDLTDVFQDEVANGPAWHEINDDPDRRLLLWRQAHERMNQEEVQEQRLLLDADSLPLTPFLVVVCIATFFVVVCWLFGRWMDQFVDVILDTAVVITQRVGRAIVHVGEKLFGQAVAT